MEHLLLCSPVSGMDQLSLVKMWAEFGFHCHCGSLHFDFSLLCIGEGNGNPLQCSSLENPRDGVAQSRTRLKWLSSSSSVVPLAQYYSPIPLVFTGAWIEGWVAWGLLFFQCSSSALNWRASLWALKESSHSPIPSALGCCCLWLVVASWMVGSEAFSLILSTSVLGRLCGPGSWGWRLFQWSHPFFNMVCVCSVMSDSLWSRGL